MNQNGRGRLASGTVRVGSLVPLPGVLRELGHDPAGVLGKIDVGLDLFDDPDRQIPYTTAGSIVAHCVSETGCQHLGLLVGQRGGLDTLGLVGFVMTSAPTVGTALADAIRFLKLHDRGGAPTLTTDAQESTLGYHVMEPGTDAIPQIHDMSMAISYNILRSLCGDGWRPLDVLLPRRRPGHAAPWTRFFRVPVQFNAGRCALVFASHWLERRPPGANALLYRHLERLASQQLFEEKRSDFVGDVRRAVRQTLAQRGRSAEQVARRLGLHERTLNRRLLAHGTTFSELRDDVLFSTARQLLGGTSMNLADVAAAFGYADATTFIRAFTRWSGQTPAQWRRSGTVAPSNCEATRGLDDRADEVGSAICRCRRLSMRRPD